jgi:hypothetical protein
VSARRLRLTTWLAAASLALGASTTAAACSSSSKASSGDGGPHDSGLDEDDAPVDTGGGGNADVVVYPDAPNLQTPDGCFILGGPCQTDTMCCTGVCDDGGCTHMPVQM